MASSFEITWQEVSCRSEATLSVKSDAHDFHVSIALAVTENGTPITNRTWTATLLRRSDLTESEQ